MTSSPALQGPASPAAGAKPAADLENVARPIPFLGIAAVLLGAILTTLTSRLTTLGLGDVRGAIGASVDEGAWIPTAFTVAQMLVGPVSVWIARVVGVRRVLLVGATVFAIAEFALPLVPDIAAFQAVNFAAGLGSGTFIPVTIGYIVQNVPRRFWPLGIGAYAMNLELSLNIAATLEGWYVEHASWHWVYWQNALIALPLLACVWYGIPRSSIDREEAAKGDYVGMLLASGGFSLLYAALDQGDRLQWFDSSQISFFLIFGTLLLASFFFHESHTRKPGINLQLLGRTNLLILFALTVVLRFLITSSGFIVPQFLGIVKGFRPLQIGDVLLWIALPQFIVAPVVGILLLWVDARLKMAIGVLLMVAAFWLGSMLTSDWTESEFVASQLIQAVGQTMALTSLIYFSVLHLRPQDALSFGAMLQTMRLFGGELGFAFIQVTTRVREQVHSLSLGEHVAAFGTITSDRLAGYAAALANSVQGDGTAAAQAVGLLDRAVRAQSYTLAYADGMTLCLLVSVMALAMVAWLKRAP